MEGYRLHVINSALTVELIVLPMTLVSYGSIFVVKFAKPMHLIIFPLTLEMPSVFEVQCPMAIPLSIGFVALIPPSFRDILLDVLKFQILVLIMELAEVSKT